jgi:hypothetical protein
MLCPHPPSKEILHECCRMDRRIVVMKPICSLGHCECDGHTVHKLIQRRLTTDWLAPRESDCSEWPPYYIKVTLPVLDIYSIWLDTFRIALVKATCLLFIVTLYQSTRQQISGDRKFQNHRYENLYFKRINILCACKVHYFTWQWDAMLSSFRSRSSDMTMSIRSSKANSS